MNRDDLKYRVWSVSDEKYITNVVLLPTGEIFHISDNGDGSCELWEGPPVVVERCTGCKAIGNKFLYVGDVVLTSCCTGCDEPSRMVVTVRDHLCTIEFEDEVDKPEAEYWYVDDEIAAECYVVGTIHDKEKKP